MTSKISTYSREHFVSVRITEDRLTCEGDEGENRQEISLDVKGLSGSHLLHKFTYPSSSFKINVNMDRKRLELFVSEGDNIFKFGYDPSILKISCFSSRPDYFDNPKEAKLDFRHVNYYGFFYDVPGWHTLTGDDVITFRMQIFLQSSMQELILRVLPTTLHGDYKLHTQFKDYMEHLQAVYWSGLTKDLPDFDFNINKFNKPTSSTDAKIIFDDGFVYVSCVYLSVSSKYFEIQTKKLPETPKNDEGFAQLEFFGSVRPFLKLLKIVYPPFHTVNEYNVKDIIQQADYYQVDFLVNECVNFLISEDSEKISILDKLNWAFMYNLPKLQNYCKTSKEISTIGKTTKYDHLCTDAKLFLLEELYETMNSWINRFEWAMETTEKGQKFCHKIRNPLSLLQRGWFLKALHGFFYSSRPRPFPVKN